MEAEDDECSVCFKVCDEVLPCCKKKGLCSPCSKKWAKKTSKPSCPLCRAIVRDWIDNLLGTEVSLIRKAPNPNIRGKVTGGTKHFIKIDGKLIGKTTINKISPYNAPSMWEAAYTKDFLKWLETSDKKSKSFKGQELRLLCDIRAEKAVEHQAVEHQLHELLSSMNVEQLSSILSMDDLALIQHLLPEQYMLGVPPPPPRPPSPPPVPPVPPGFIFPQPRPITDAESQRRAQIHHQWRSR